MYGLTPIKVNPQREYDNACNKKWENKYLKHKKNPVIKSLGSASGFPGHIMAPLLIISVAEDPIQTFSAYVLLFFLCTVEPMRVHPRDVVRNTEVKWFIASTGEQSAMADTA